MTAKRVLSVGQCAADHGEISRLLRTAFGADVTPAHDAAEAIARLRREAFDLVLVNRLFDADGDSGLELIRRLGAVGGSKPPPVMLVSNHDDAQREAIAAGAVPGFGKASLSTTQTATRLAAFLK
jgi:two-component system chemotaxis response regulator CheY